MTGPTAAPGPTPGVDLAAVVAEQQKVIAGLLARTAVLKQGLVSLAQAYDETRVRHLRQVPLAGNIRAAETHMQAFRALAVQSASPATQVAIAVDPWASPPPASPPSLEER